MGWDKIVKKAGGVVSDAGNTVVKAAKDVVTASVTVVTAPAKIGIDVASGKSPTSTLKHVAETVTDAVGAR